MKKQEKEYTVNVAEWKKDIVKKLKVYASKYPIIGVVNMEGLPAKQLQKMRYSLRENDVVLVMARKKIMKKALEETGNPDLAKLYDYMKGIPALLFTKENPFKLCKFLEKNKSNAPAKANQIAPKDIIVKAGGTSFSPGPIIGELGSVGIKTKIEGGKVAITQDSVVRKQGQVIDAKLAGILQRLAIEPMEIGLDLQVMYENGTFFTKDVLAVDEAEYIRKLTNAATECINLSVSEGIPTKDTIELILTKVERDSRAISISEYISTKETIFEIIKKAERIALNINK